MIDAYTTCEELPLYNYIRCVVYGDLSHLLTQRDRKEAGERKEELEKIWAAIQGEYVNLVEQSIDTYALSTYYEMEYTRMQIIVVSNALDVMAKYRHPGFADLLKEMGYPFRFDINDEDGYMRDVMGAFTRHKRLHVDLEEAEAKLNALKVKESKPTVAFFDKVLTALSKFMNAQIDEKSMTVSRYAATLNAYTHYVETLQNQTNARQNK